MQSVNITKPVESSASNTANSANSLACLPVRTSGARESMGCLVAGPSSMNTPPPSTTRSSTQSMEMQGTLQSNTPATGSSTSSVTSGPSSGGDASRVLHFPLQPESSTASTMLASAFPPPNGMANSLQLPFIPNLSLNATNLQTALMGDASAGMAQSSVALPPSSAMPQPPPSLRAQ
eukprot:2615255-Rhodomonas_salina.1